MNRTRESVCLADPCCARARSGVPLIAACVAGAWATACLRAPSRLAGLGTVPSARARLMRSLSSAQRPAARASAAPGARDGH
eukprot:9634641-Lingulodinium_polyedra.AAC.1